MWSIGVTAYLLLCGETPFNGKNRQQLFRRISCDDPTFPDDKWGHISDEAVDFVRKLLTKDPAKRLSAVEALKHRWLVDNHGAKKQTSFQTMTDSSEEFSELTETTKKSRDPPDVHAPVAQSTSPRAKAHSNHAIANNAKPVPTRSSSAPVPTRSPARSTSRSSSRTRRPPPPPPPQAPRDVSLTASRASAPPADEDKAKLLDVIKEQDAKIERLEAMVKRMLEPEGGAVYDC